MKVLFLDRDGVINIENMHGYILEKKDFVFYEGVPEAIRFFNSHFDKTIVVTNQRCVGKGLISEEGLKEIHDFMLAELALQNASIDAIFYAPELEDNHPNRKPNIGMGIQAKEKYPDIDFPNSVMVGNNLSDMKFGKQLGMKTVFLTTTSDYIDESHAKWCDFHFASLKEFADFYRFNHHLTFEHK